MPLTDEDLSQLEQLYFEGRFAELELRGQFLTEQYPGIGLVWSVLGAALSAQGKSALPAYSRAAELLPHDPQAQLQYADTLLAEGQAQAAIPAYQSAIALQPNWAAAHNNLGNAFKALGRTAEARRHYDSALQFDRRFALAHYNLALLSRDAQQWDSVEPQLRMALEADPTLAPAWVELASVLKDLGDLTGAEKALEKAIELSPQLIQAQLNLATVFLLQGRASVAELHARNATQLDPTSAEAHLQLGMALQGMGRDADARARIEHALSLCDTLIEGYKLLSDLACEDGDMDSAVQLLHQVLKHDPGNVQARSRSLFYRSQAQDASPEDLFSEHEAYGHLLSTKVAPTLLSPAGSNQRPTRALRVGFVSGDFNNHIVGRSLLPVLASLAGFEDLELVAYSNNPEEDEWSLSLKKQFSAWNVTIGMSPTALARRIRSDEVHILIDLSGHTPMNCLEAFALRPAPVQASWLGYTWTTGVRQVDYYFADPCWLPVGEFDHLFVEKLVYLSAFLPFAFQGISPPVNELPCQTGAPFTFASFNHQRKLSSKLIDAWGHILSGVHGSRLVLGGLDDGPKKDQILAAFTRLGIARERLLFSPRCKPYDYLQSHHAVDICLDAFPYPSATTVQHALWMGVPTITIAGPTPVSRAGAAALEHLGLSQYIADTSTAYIDKAIGAARQLGELAILRRTLRQRFAESAQCDIDGIARSLHGALLSMWARHVDDKPAQALLAQTLRRT